LVDKKNDSVDTPGKNVGGQPNGSAECDGTGGCTKATSKEEKKTIDKERKNASSWTNGWGVPPWVVSTIYMKEKRVEDMAKSRRSQGNTPFFVFRTANCRGTEPLQSQCFVHGKNNRKAFLKGDLKRFLFLFPNGGGGRAPETQKEKRPFKVGLQPNLGDANLWTGGLDGEETLEGRDGAFGRQTKAGEMGFFELVRCRRAASGIIGKHYPWWSPAWTILKEKGESLRGCSRGTTRERPNRA